MANPIKRFAATVLFLGASFLGAQGPGRPPMRHYGSEEGLGSEVVTALTQTTDGMIWAATEAGLVIFEGHRFAPYSVEGLPSPLLTNLYADQDGSLWVTTDAGIARLMNRKFTVLGESEGLPRTSYQKVARDGQGRLWILGNRALFVEVGPMRFMQAPAPPVPEPPVQFYADRGQPTVLAITARHLFEWKDGSWVPLQAPPVAAGEQLLNVAMDAEGAIWARSSTALWQLPRAGAWRKERARITGGFSFSSRLDRDSQGWIWFDDFDGLWRVKGGLRQRFSWPGEDAKGGMVDQEGGIWIRTDHGVTRTLGRSRWAGYDMRDGLTGKLVWQPLRDSRGRLWVATDKGLCVALDEGFRTVIPGRILSLALAPDGRMWATGSPGGTVFEVDTATLTWKTHTVDVLPRSRITSGLAVDAHGTPWVADRDNGVARGIRSGGGWTWEIVPVGGRTPKDLLGIVALPGDGLIVIHDGGASLMRHGEWKRIPDLLPDYPGAVGLGPSGKVVFSYRNRPELTLHRLTEDSMERMDTVRIPVKAGFNYFIFSVAMDPSGRVWVGSNAGLGVLNGKDFQMMGMEDRLVSPECNEWSILAEADRVWLGTTTGLAVFSSDLPAMPPSLKPPTILWARAGGLELDPDGRAVQVPRKFNELELKFMIPTYQAPGRIFYETRLRGVDPDWVRTDGQVRYAGLQAGHHVLELRGSLPDGIIGPVKNFEFFVTPAWWETTWARTTGILAMAAGTWLLIWLRSVALRRRNRQLQEEVARQTAALQEASRAKSAFLANMSHELRTPLNAILLYSELLQEEAKDRGLGSITDDASRINQAGASLLNLIDDILDISKIEAGHMRIDLEEIEVEPFLRNIDSSLRPVVERNGNVFRVNAEEAPGFITCDPTRLQQILANLLGNAAKFTAAGEVTLRAFREGDVVAFQVEDTGIGMTPEEQEKVFSEFVQADSSTTRKYGGTGLGLTLVQRLTGMLGGQVVMESARGVGTRVTVRLPIGTGA